MIPPLQAESFNYRYFSDEGSGGRESRRALGLVSSALWGVLVTGHGSMVFKAVGFVGAHRRPRRAAGKSVLHGVPEDSQRLVRIIGELRCDQDRQAP